LSASGVLHKKIGSSNLIQSFIPSFEILIFSLLSFIICLCSFNFLHISTEKNFLNYGIHVIIGGLCLVILGVLGYWKEKNFLNQIRTLFSLRQKKKEGK